jgi:hypothetical protein
VVRATSRPKANARLKVKAKSRPKVKAKAKAKAKARPSSRFQRVAPAHVVGNVLQTYAKRGVFRGYAEGESRRGKTVYKMLWHYGLVFELELDAKTGTLLFPIVLPHVTSRSAMYQAFKPFIDAFSSTKVPEHRRIDKTKMRISAPILAGNVAVRAKVLDGDFDYATRKLVHLVQEIFLCFLCDGPYVDYRIENLGLNPDAA